MTAPKNAYALNIDQVRKFLPHRSPFLLIDRVLEMHPKGDLKNMNGSEDKIGTTVIALKNVTYNEPCFAGHFPDFSVYPGVLTLEAMAQTASFVSYPYIQSNPEQAERGFGVFLVGLDGVRFRKPIIPGDRLLIEAKRTKCRSMLWGFEVTAQVEGQKVAEAELLANLILK